jgi:hypothetical protein
MLRMDLQFFAHKKGVGSTKNGRDSESKRLGAKRADGQFVKAGNILFRQDSSWCERWYRRRRHIICTCRWCFTFREKG